MHTSYAAAVAMDGIYATILFTNIILKHFYKGSYFYSQMVLGCCFELLGFSAAFSSDSRQAYVLTCMGIAVGTVNFMAAVYFSFADTMRVCGAKYALLKPRLFNWVFEIVSLATCLLFLLPALCTIHVKFASKYNVRLYITLGGMTLQVYTICAFLTLVCVFFWKARRAKLRGYYEAVPENSVNSVRFHKLRHSRLFRIHVILYLLSTVLILVRTIAGLVRLAQGSYGVPYLGVETVSMVIAVAFLTILTPGVAMRRRKRKKKDESENSSGDV